MSNTNFAVQSDEKTLVVERTFRAPIQRVWQAYTNPDLISQWWGPRGWETENKHMDFSEGGYWHYGMKCIDPEQKEWYGKTSWGKATYKNIKANDSFEYTDAFCNENGDVTPGMPVSHTILSLREKNGSTAVKTTTRYESADALSQVLEMGMKEGFTQTWDRLEEFLAE